MMFGWISGPFISDMGEFVGCRHVAVGIACAVIVDSTYMNNS